MSTAQQEPWGRVVLQTGEQMCPQCDCCANRIGTRLACAWCGAVTARDNEGKWHVVDTCMLANGGWP